MGNSIRLRERERAKEREKEREKSSAGGWTTGMVSLPWKGHMPPCAIIHCAQKQHPHPQHIRTQTHTMAWPTQLKMEDGAPGCYDDHTDVGLTFIFTLIVFVKFKRSECVTNIPKESVKISTASVDVSWYCVYSMRSSLYHENSCSGESYVALPLLSCFAGYFSVLAVVLKTNNEAPWTDEFDSKSLWTNTSAKKFKKLFVFFTAVLNSSLHFSLSCRNWVIMFDWVHFYNQSQNWMEEDNKWGTKLCVLWQEDLR